VSAPTDLSNNRAYIDLFIVCLTFFEFLLAIFALFGFEGLVS
jgi:hypothetical protein